MSWYYQAQAIQPDPSYHLPGPEITNPPFLVHTDDLIVHAQMVPLDGWMLDPTTMLHQTTPTGDDAQFNQVLNGQQNTAGLLSLGEHFVNTHIPPVTEIPLVQVKLDYVEAEIAGSGAVGAARGLIDFAHEYSIPDAVVIQDPRYEPVYEDITGMHLMEGIDAFEVFKPPDTEVILRLMQDITPGGTPDQTLMEDDTPSGTPSQTLFSDGTPSTPSTNLLEDGTPGE